MCLWGESSGGRGVLETAYCQSRLPVGMQNPWPLELDPSWPTEINFLHGENDQRKRFTNKGKSRTANKESLFCYYLHNGK